ncbi:hypothetical protein ACS8FA_14550, partial [Psychrobacter sp. 1Y1]|uniref:hypothetical protein n=1 Tax=Psychrobacter sp. 1Y1 TaxID=3453574 RepID=UPI003F45674A
MRLRLLALVVGLGFTSMASATQVEVCNQDINSVVCHNYLEGVVDGALMYKGAAVGKRLESDGYES